MKLRYLAILHLTHLFQSDHLRSNEHDCHTRSHQPRTCLSLQCWLVFVFHIPKIKFKVTSGIDK